MVWLWPIGKSLAVDSLSSLAVFPRLSKKFSSTLIRYDKQLCAYAQTRLRFKETCCAQSLTKAVMIPNTTISENKLQDV